jgi:hypothetical protein
LNSSLHKFNYYYLNEIATNKRSRLITHLHPQRYYQLITTPLINPIPTRPRYYQLITTPLITHIPTHQRYYQLITTPLINPIPTHPRYYQLITTPLIAHIPTHQPPQHIPLTTTLFPTIPSQISTHQPSKTKSIQQPQTQKVQTSSLLRRNRQWQKTWSRNHAL